MLYILVLLGFGAPPEHPNRLSALPQGAFESRAERNAERPRPSSAGFDVANVHDGWIVALRGSTDKAEPVTGPLAGRTVCVTGKFSSMKRSEVTELCKAHGARVSTGVTQATDLLIVGEKPGSKLVKATALGIEVITEADLLSKLTPGR